MGVCYAYYLSLANQPLNYQKAETEQAEWPPLYPRVLHREKPEENRWDSCNALEGADHSTCRQDLRERKEGGNVMIRRKVRG